MKKVNTQRKKLLVRQAKKKGLKRSERQKKLAKRRTQSGSASKTVIRRTSLMKRILKGRAHHAATPTLDVTAPAKERPTFLSSVKNKIWNRKTGK